MSVQSVAPNSNGIRTIQECINHTHSQVEDDKRHRTATSLLLLRQFACQYRVCQWAAIEGIEALHVDNLACRISTLKSTDRPAV